MSDRRRLLKNDYFVVFLFSTFATLVKLKVSDFEDLIKVLPEQNQSDFFV